MVKMALSLPVLV